jgi:DNA-binding beta-propeller fold protein YncE
MRRLHAAAGVAVLLLFAFMIQGSKAWGGNDAPHDQAKSSHLSLLRTYTPEEFQESLLDRLSGGLAQRAPYRMAADSQGRILVTDPVLSLVHVFDTRQGKRWQIKGDRYHPLNAPAHVAVDADDNIYLTDLEQSVVSVLRPDGHFIRTIGVDILRLPTGIWVDKENRRLYVADWIRDEILSFDLEGKPLQVFGSFGTAPGQLNHPVDILVHHDTLVVLDSGNSRFELFDLQGKVRGTWPYGPDRTPTALACDAAGNLYYADSVSGGLVAMDSQGKVLAGFGQRRFGQWVPRWSARQKFMSLALDASGNILAIRPTFDVEVLKLTSDATG